MIKIIRRVANDVYRNQQHSRWLCRCFCGRLFECRQNSLRSGNTRSCGCLRYRNTIRGENEHITAEYRAWAEMKRRCYNSRCGCYMRYGGRGIIVCSRWLLSYRLFLQDMGRKPSVKHSIDRINNDGNYEPTNCRWATPHEQAVNKPINKRLKNGRWAKKEDK